MTTAAPIARFVLGPPIEPPPKHFVSASVVCPVCGQPVHVLRILAQAGNLFMTCDRAASVQVTQVEGDATPPSALLSAVCANDHDLQILFMSTERGLELWIPSVNDEKDISAGSTSDCDAGGK